MAPPALDLAAELRALYRAPLAEFVDARQALARRLRLARDERAAEVRTLRKPSLSAWAVNQLFAGDPQGVAALVAAGEHARAAHESVAGGADPQPLRDQLLTIREQAARLTERAIDILTAADRPPGEAIVERLRADLDALALDPATAPVAERGWLDEDLEPPGFEILAPLQLAAAVSRRAAPGAPAAPAAPAARVAPVEQLDDRRKAIAERRERERRERIELRAELDRAEAEAAERRSAAERAVAAATRAAAELEAARQRSTEAEAAAEATRRSATEAEAAASRAREALADAGDP